MDIAVGMVMTSFTIYNGLSEDVQEINAYRKTLNKKTTAFRQTMKMIRAKLDDLERSESGEESATTIVNALTTILNYSADIRV